MNHSDVNYFDTLDKELKDVLVKYLENHSLPSLVLILVDVYRVKAESSFYGYNDYCVRTLEKFLENLNG